MLTVQFKTDEETKAQSDEVFGMLGISMSDAINLFLRQSILHGGLPFELKIPKYNKTTLNALADMEHSKGKGIRGKNVRTALADLKAEDGDDNDYETRDDGDNQLLLVRTGSHSDLLE